MKPSSLLRLLPLLCLVGFLSACAGDKEKEMPDRPVEELYTEATDLMDKKEFKAAAHSFEEVERQHPYSQWATRAQLMTGFALYQAMDYDGSIAALDQFIRIHPGSDSLAYAYYLRALCDYERLADVRRDQSYAQNALKQLQAIVSRFPTTSYAKDAVLKIALVNDHLAGAEMEVGRNYMSAKLFTAAIGRFRTVVDKYQTTSHVPEALHRLVECYLALGIMNEAKSTAAVLGHNFPGSQWYQDSYSLLVKNNLAPEEEDESWIKKTWKTIF
ncbi:MAG: outer membrane protein assembly factor BamD [Alphaproteobacteria bacterium]|nr:outer membrane protein assembly factor BamD [Alphaproteobacteria bacterium]